MAWSAPKTWSSGYVVLAADMNNIRDQLNATAPATVTAQGDIVIASGANALARLAKSTTSTQYLANTGTSNAPAWNEVALATGVSGTLPVANGGTGGTSLTANGILVGNSTSAIAVTATMATKGHVMVGDGSGVPSMLAVGTNDYILTADSGEATGVKWAAAAGGGGQLTLIATAAASTSASLTITGLDSTYDSYLLLGSDLHPVNDGIELWIRVGDSSGIDSGASDYSYHVARIDSADANYLAHVSGGAAQIALAFSGIGNAAGEGIGFALWLHRPGDGSTQPMISGTHTFLTNLTAFQGGPIIARRNAVITLDRVQVLFQTGSIVSGRFTVFGAKHD